MEIGKTKKGKVTHMTQQDKNKKLVKKPMINR